MNGTPDLAAEVFAARSAAAAQGDDILRFVRQLYPICRSITGAGLRQTLAEIGRRIPLDLTEVPSGTPVFDWTVPQEWNIRGAHLRHESGRVIADFKQHNLHIVNYSMPVRKRLSLEELKPRLFGLPQHPEWIPYRTSYYKDSWGFCLPQAVIDALEPGWYEVVIDSSLQPGALSYGECVLPGESAKEVMIFTHCCHPSLCNDNLSGIAVATHLAERIAARRRHFTYRFIFAPATIGSITWLARNESRLGRIEHGLVIGLLGDAAPFTYKRSRRGRAPVDRIAEYVLTRLDRATRVRDFSPYGYDERQFCSPGFDLPVGRITRSSNAEYPEYHSSADNLEFITAEKLDEAFAACLKVLAVVDSCATYVNLAPKCEPRLGKYGLYGALGGTGPADSEYALLWVLNQSDGKHDLVDIAERSGLEYALILRAARALEQAGLLARAPSTPA
jgi:aminopeptidase-like protein